MTEVEATIGVEQLKKLDALTSRRIEAANRLSAGLSGLKGLRPPVVKKDCTHVYYVYPLLYSPEETSLPRDQVFKALVAEGVPITDRYMSIFIYCPSTRRKLLMGRRDYPGVRTSTKEMCLMKKASVRWRKLCRTQNFWE